MSLIIQADLVGMDETDAARVKRNKEEWNIVSIVTARGQLTRGRPGVCSDLRSRASIAEPYSESAETLSFADLSKSILCMSGYFARSESALLDQHNPRGKVGGVRCEDTGRMDAITSSRKALVASVRRLPETLLQSFPLAAVIVRM